MSPRRKNIQENLDSLCLTLLFGRSFDVVVVNKFTERAGKITGYTLIVCELNPFVYNSLYHDRMPTWLPTLRQVGLELAKIYKLFYLTQPDKIATAYFTGSRELQTK